MGDQHSGHPTPAYLAPDYLHDVFVTYSHGDFDGTGDSELKAWSQKFAKKLESELRQIPKFKNSVVFLDESKRAEHRLDKTLPLTDQIRAGVEGAALLTVLMTPHYLESGWCRDEREWWLTHHGERGDTSGRVFVARVWPTEAEWPEALRDERGHTPIGFWFHARENVDYGTRPFGWNGRTDDQNEFTKSLLDLVSVVARRLETLRKELDEHRRAQEDADRISALGRQILYLHAREAHRDAWAKAVSALGKIGYVVMPSAPEPTAGDPKRLQEIKAERTELLGDCDALLLLGTTDGDALDRDMVAIGHQRRNSARAQAGKQLPCAILDTAGRPVNSEHRVGNARRLGIHWIDATAPDWPEAVGKWLALIGEQLREAA
jgi:hypothetical protein